MSIFLYIFSQESTMNILPELSDGLNVLLDQLVKSSFVIEKQLTHDQNDWTKHSRS